MVVQNKKIVTYLMLSASFSFMPLFMSAFGVRQHSLLFTPLIVFHHRLHITNHPLSSFVVKPLTTHIFGFLVMLVLSLFLLMNKTLVSCSSLLLGYSVSQKGFRCYDPITHRLHVSRHVEFQEHCPFTSLLQFPVSSFSESPIY